MKNMIRFLFFVYWLNLYGSIPEQSYWTTHVAGMDEWSLIFPAEKGKEAYIDYRLALQIIEVECDGKKVQPSLREAMVRFNYETIPASGSQVLYTPRFYELRTAVLENGKFSVEKVLEYDIPKNARSVIVHYRVRYPKDDMSGGSVISSLDRYLAKVNPTRQP